MAALTKDRRIVSREGDQFSDSVLAATKIFGGSLVCLDAAGLARPGADAAGLKIRGVAQEQVDNTAGANGEKLITSCKGVYQFEATGLTIADIGATMFILDDQTVTKAATTNNIVAGTLQAIEGSTKAFVKIS